MNGSTDRENNDIPTENEIEEEANSYTGLFKHCRVTKREYKRFIYLSLILGIVGFVYSFMRIIKDTYVMVRQDPICILYLKIFYVMPITFLVVLGVNYMLTYKTVSEIFSLVAWCFTSLFLIFAFFILYEDSISFSKIPLLNKVKLNFLNKKGMGFFKYFFMTLREPLATSIYVSAEVWGSLMLSYFFFSYLNEVCESKRQHGRFLTPLLIVVNISLLISAMVTTVFFKIRENLSYDKNLYLMAGIFLIEAFLSMALIYLKHTLETVHLPNPVFIPNEEYSPSGQNNENNEANNHNKSNTEEHRSVSPGLRESLSIMSRSRFLLAISMVVFFYSIVFNMLESIYKNGVKHGAESLNIEKGKYSGKFGNFEQYFTAISVILINLSSFSKSVDTYGWTTVAIATPLISGISVLLICGFSLYNLAASGSSIRIINRIFKASSPKIRMENWTGCICLSLMKIFKFVAFDLTKEKIAMRINQSHRSQFKSIFDGIFNKLGKSGGALYGILLTGFLSDLDIRELSMVSVGFLVPFIAMWIYFVYYLGHSYNESVKHNCDVNIDIDGPVHEKEVQEDIPKGNIPEITVK